MSYKPVPVPVADLDDLLTLASSGHTSAMVALAFLERSGEPTGIEKGKSTKAALLSLCERLEKLGAVDRAPLVPPPPTDPLAELARAERSRSEALALLDVLGTARAHARALDEKRGTGEDWEDLIETLQARLRLEVYGPSDRVTGGRE